MRRKRAGSSAARHSRRSTGAVPRAARNNIRGCYHSIRRSLVWILVALTLVLAFGINTASSVGEDQKDNTKTASVVSSTTSAPAVKRTIVKRFRPWAKPNRAQLKKIVRWEARKWGVSAAGMTRRINCESSGSWSLGPPSGPAGVLQFFPETFRRGMSSIGTRRIRIVTNKTKRFQEREITRYSDGTQKVRVTRTFRGQRRYVLEGTLPRRPSLYHAWAQVRIGARAMKGLGAVRNAEWTCGA